MNRGVRSRLSNNFNTVRAWIWNANGVHSANGRTSRQSTWRLVRRRSKPGVEREYHRHGACGSGNIDRKEHTAWMALDDGVLVQHRGGRHGRKCEDDGLIELGAPDDCREIALSAAAIRCFKEALQTDPLPYSNTKTPAVDERDDVGPLPDGFGDAPCLSLKSVQLLSVMRDVFVCV